jgi:hypothetical protein
MTREAAGLSLSSFPEKSISGGQENVVDNVER